MLKRNKLLISIVFVGILWTKAASLLSMPFLTIFLSKNTNLSITTIGIIVGLQPLALCFSSVIGGYLSDIFRRQTLMLLSVIASALVFLGFYLSSIYLVSTSQIICFALLNLLNGFASALFSPASRAILSDIAKSAEENIKFMHIRYIALNIGATLGPLAGAYAGVAASDKAFLVTAILYMLFSVVLLAVLKEYTQGAKKASQHKSITFFSTLKELINSRRFMALLVSLFIFNIIYSQLSSNIALVITKNIVDGTIFFSWMLSLNAILIVILQPIIYIIIKKRDQSLIVMYGYLVTIVCSIIVIFLPINELSITLFVIFLTVAEILVFPTGSVLVIEFTPETHRGTAYGVIDLEYLGSAIGPAIGGLVIQYFAVKSLFILITVLSILSIIVYLPCLNKSKLMNIA